MAFRMAPVLEEDDWQIKLDVRDDGIAILTLDHPEKLNAWSWEATRQLGVRAEQIRFDERIRAVILQAEGRAFCAGIDLGMPEDRITGRSPAEKVRNYYEGIRWVHERFRVFHELPQPIIAAVHGYCLGFGFELALMCDIESALMMQCLPYPKPRWASRLTQEETCGFLMKWGRDGQSYFHSPGDALMRPPRSDSVSFKRSRRLKSCEPLR